MPGSDDVFPAERVGFKGVNKVLYLVVVEGTELLTVTV
jgi:hypothetical protein